MGLAKANSKIFNSSTAWKPWQLELLGKRKFCIGFSQTIKTGNSSHNFTIRKCSSVLMSLKGATQRRW